MRVNYIDMLDSILSTDRVASLYKDTSISQGTGPDGLNEVTRVGAKLSTRQIAVAKLFYLAAHNAPEKLVEIGRLDTTGDLAQLKAEGGEEGAKIGHVQPKTSGWTVCANDCWMLGAFHAGKNFRVNKLAAETVWSLPGTTNMDRETFSSAYKNGRNVYGFTVTRRELTSLVQFGYKIDSVTGNDIVFRCDPQQCDKATLESYVAAVSMENRASLPASLQEMMAG